MHELYDCIQENTPKGNLDVLQTLLLYSTSAYVYLRLGIALQPGLLRLLRLLLCYILCPSTLYSCEPSKPHPGATPSLLTCYCCCCCCCCSHINSHNQARGHRTGSSHSGAEEYPRENTHTHNPRWYTHISQLTHFMPPPETYKSD